MLNILKEQFYYKNLSAEDLIKSIANNHYIELAMSNSPFNVIQDTRENLVILQNQYNSIQFTFSNNLKSKENKIIDIREIKNILKEAVHEKMVDMADCKKRIIYENYKSTKKHNIGTYTVIVNLMDSRFRIYQGMKYSTGNISVEYMTIEEDMFEVMKNTLNSKVN